jgi:hypothetical protein
MNHILFIEEIKRRQIPCSEYFFVVILCDALRQDELGFRYYTVTLIFSFSNISAHTVVAILSINVCGG